MKRMSENQIKNIIDMYQNGSSPKEIGEKHQIYSESVNRILKRKGINKNQCVKNNMEKINLIISRYESGESSELIVKDLNIDGTTVCRILKRNSVTIRKNNSTV
jgi:DNA invertase Pin-like site-specific DNA recombinase